MHRSHLADKTLDVLQSVAALGCASLPDIQSRSGLPLTTAHRIIETLIKRGFVMRMGRGQYRMGTSALALAHNVSHDDLLIAAARGHLQSLSRQTRSHVHLGVFEDGMVTYLIKRSYGKVRVHSVEGAQLEAYCSALGKVLLSALTEDALEHYLATDTFVALTPNTLIDPEALRQEIQLVRTRGWSEDREEIAIGLRCLGAPIRNREGRIIAAVSVSTLSNNHGAANRESLVSLTTQTAKAIGDHLFPV